MGKTTVPDVINYCFSMANFKNNIKQSPSTFLNKYLSAPFSRNATTGCLVSGSAPLGPTVQAQMNWIPSWAKMRPPAPRRRRRRLQHRMSCGHGPEFGFGSIKLLALTFFLAETLVCFVGLKKKSMNMQVWYGLIACKFVNSRKNCRKAEMGCFSPGYSIHVEPKNIWKPWWHAKNHPLAPRRGCGRVFIFEVSACRCWKNDPLTRPRMGTVY